MIRAAVARGARIRSAVVAALFLSSLVVGCGDDDDGTPPVEGPLPTGAEDPQAYTEAFMSRNALAFGQLPHLIIDELEPTSAAVMSDEVAVLRPFASRGHWDRQR